MRASAKKSIDDLALFGGAPLFSSIRPIGQLASGDPEQFMGYIDQIYAERRFTNNGTLVRLLEERLATMHDVPHCVAVGNASLGLIIIMSMLADGRNGTVLMPAFTYPGLPHLATWAGQTPVFCDVDKTTHTLNVNSVKKNINEQSTSILGVHHFNHPCAIDELNALSQATGVPVFYDSVHGVAATYKGDAIGRFGVAEVFSLHATKLINGFEGGYITTNDSSFADELKKRRNFGFDSETERSDFLGMNAKLNEFHAAMSLCSLDVLDDVILRNEERFRTYQSAFADLRGLNVLDYPEKEEHNYEFAILEVTDDSKLSRNEIVDILRAENALCRAYYSPPLHTDENFSDCIGVGGLPTTEYLADRFVQMPVGEKLSPVDIEQLADLFIFLEDNDAELDQKIRDAGTKHAR